MEQQDYIRDISEIRSMMEKSTKFLSLSGWAGIMAGVYALVGAYLAYELFGFNPDLIFWPDSSKYNNDLGSTGLILLGIAVLVLAIGTAVLLSGRRAAKRNEKLWNATSRRLLANMAVPLAAGGLFVLMLISQGLIGLVAPVTLIFYGLSLYVASKFTYDDLKILGFTDICLGLAASYFIGYGLLFWALGFGVAHIIYGIYVHFKYEK